MPFLLIDFFGRKLAHVVTQTAAKFVVVHFRARDSDNCEVVRKKIAVLEVVECGNQFPLGEITGRAKDHQDAGRTYVYSTKSARIISHLSFDICHLPFIARLIDPSSVLIFN